MSRKDNVLVPLILAAGALYMAIAKRGKGIRDLAEEISHRVIHHDPQLEPPHREKYIRVIKPKDHHHGT